MIIVEKIENGFRTYSDIGLKIKPILDRTGQQINEYAIYDLAEDIEINGNPRFDYIETDVPIEI